MSKVLTGHELLEIVTDTVRNGRASMTEELGQQREFLAALAELVAYHGGADLVSLYDPDEEHSWEFVFEANECTPDDGGVFKFFDTDQPVEEWINTTLED